MESLRSEEFEGKSMALSRLRKDLGGALLPFSAATGRGRRQSYVNDGTRSYEALPRYCRRPAQHRRVCTCLRRKGDKMATPECIRTRIGRPSAKRNRRCPTRGGEFSLGRIPIQSAAVAAMMTATSRKKGCGAAASFGSRCYQAAKTSCVSRNGGLR
jgi:hypothetical protein